MQETDNQSKHEHGGIHVMKGVEIRTVYHEINEKNSGLFCTLDIQRYCVRKLMMINPQSCATRICYRKKKQNCQPI